MKRKTEIFDTEQQMPTVRVLSIDYIKECIGNQQKKCAEDTKSFCRNKAIELLYGYFIDEDEDSFMSVNETLALDILRFLMQLSNN